MALNPSDHRAANLPVDDETAERLARFTGLGLTSFRDADATSRTVQQLDTEPRLQLRISWLSARGETGQA